MKYATWNLRPIDDGFLDGPESSIVERGGSAESVWASGAVETGATILGKVSGNLDNLDLWNVTEVSRQEAESFIEANFTPYTDAEGNFYSLQDVLKVLD
jgi:hypothetical protein